MNLPLYNPAPLRDEAPAPDPVPAVPADATSINHHLDANELALREHQRHVREASYAPPPIDFFRVH
jgi:hypothetical protein